ncbi:MAG: hypothetical protein C4293_02655 [Nitrospiraceae bacterium]
MKMEIRQMVRSLESFVSRPAFPDLLQKQVPFGTMPVAARRLRPEITQGIGRERPTLQVPLPGLAVRTTDPFAESVQERPYRGVPVHRR